MGHKESDGSREDKIKDILHSARNAAIRHNLQAADIEACSSDFEARMIVKKRWDAWESKNFSLGWLNGCAENFAYNYHRALTFLRAHGFGDDAAQAEAAELASPEPAPVQEALRNEISGELNSALGTLPATHRIMVTMRVREERSYNEIATAFGTTPDAARMTVNRALEVVRSHLDHGDFDADEAMRILASPPRIDGDSSPE